MSDKKILIVEDDRGIRDGLSRLLRGAGYTVTAAASVAEGLAALDGQAVALLDLMLPDGLGTTVLQEIRRRGHPFRVAILTAAPSHRVARDALAAVPPDRLFSKPLDVDDLLDWLAAAA
jgi:CheY-like chemotaxis protein